MTIIGSIVGSAGFIVDHTCSNATIDAGKKRVCEITYNPTAHRAVSGATLTIYDNAGDSPQTVVLTGTGT